MQFPSPNFAGLTHLSTLCPLSFPLGNVRIFLYVDCDMLHNEEGVHI